MHGSRQWFLNLSVYPEQLEGLSKHIVLDPHPRIPDLVDLGWGPSSHLSNKFPSSQMMVVVVVTVRMMVI